MLGTQPPSFEELSRRYAAMSAEEFSLVLRDDLTSVGQEAFDHEMQRRGIKPPVAPTLTEDQLAQAVYAFTAEQLANGVPGREVMSTLISRGIEADAAASVVGELRQIRNDAAEVNMRQGAMWCIGGCFVTAITYVAASSGRPYVIAWGAILFGAIQFFRGLAQVDRE